MIDKVRLLIERQRELILYCVIGCSGVVIDYFGFAVLTHYTGLYYQLANAISVSMGIFNNFIWNAHFNFKVKDRMLLRFLSFYCVGMTGLSISAALLYLFIETLSCNLLLSKLSIIFIVTIMQFLLNKFVTFKKWGVSRFSAALVGKLESYKIPVVWQWIGAVPKTHKGKIQLGLLK